jgi:diketogulonate reductase-like aldo/keto reductase
MNYESIGNVTLPKIGFGTWKIGGEMSPDRARDAWSLAALRSALELGYTHFDTAEMYASGHAEELLGQAIRESAIPREALFITSKVTPSNLEYDRVLRSCEASLRRLGIDYLDLYLIHWPGNGMRLGDTFLALNKLVSDGKVRHLGVSNFDLKLLKQSQSLSETPILTNQAPYSLSDRSYVENGVLAYCQKNNILVTAYSPVEEGNLKVTAALQDIAKAHRATPYQIALAWVVTQPRVITIPMSANPKHQAENLAAADIVLSRVEMEQLDRQQA